MTWLALVRMAKGLPIGIFADLSQLQSRIPIEISASCGPTRLFTHVVSSDTILGAPESMRRMRKNKNEETTNDQIWNVQLELFYKNNKLLPVHDICFINLSIW